MSAVPTLGFVVRQANSRMLTPMATAAGIESFLIEGCMRDPTMARVSNVVRHSLLVSRCSSYQVCSVALSGNAFS
jgi:hypothetical protein